MTKVTTYLRQTYDNANLQNIMLGKLTYNNLKLRYLKSRGYDNFTTNLRQS